MLEPFTVNINTGEITFFNRFTLYPSEPKKNILESEFYHNFSVFKFQSLNQKRGPVFLNFFLNDLDIAFFIRLDFHQSRLSALTFDIPDLENQSNQTSTCRMIIELLGNESDQPFNNMTQLYPWGIVKVYVDKKYSFLKISIDYLLSLTSADPSISEKSAPLFSITTGKLKVDLKNVPKSRDLARNYRREEFAKSLGYGDYDSLTINSVCFFEYQALNFYFSYNRNSGRVLIWNDRAFKIAAEFAGWLECFRAMETESFAAIINRELKRYNQTGVEMGY